MTSDATQLVEPASEDGTEQIFRRILVGIDGSPESREAARQAAILGGGRSRVTLLAAWQVVPAMIAATGVSLPVYFDEDAEHERARQALEQAREDIAPFTSPIGKATRDFGASALLREIEREYDTLVALGSHGGGRMRGIVLGSTTTELVHRAPCSVLVARPAADDFPRRIVVGVDGSSESELAYGIAASLAERFGTELWPVVAGGGHGVDKRRVAAIVDRYEELTDEPVEALVAAAADADLVVVGSRGLHGLKALGSVSERVAHRARCSTLIVRLQHWTSAG